MLLSSGTASCPEGSRPALSRGCWEGPGLQALPVVASPLRGPARWEGVLGARLPQPCPHTLPGPLCGWPSLPSVLQPRLPGPKLQAGLSGCQPSGSPAAGIDRQAQGPEDTRQPPEAGGAPNRFSCSLRRNQPRRHPDGGLPASGPCENKRLLSKPPISGIWLWQPQEADAGFRMYLYKTHHKS